MGENCWKQGEKALQRRRTNHYYLNSGESYLDFTLWHGLPSGNYFKVGTKNSCEKASKDFHRKKKETPSMSKKIKQIQPKKSIIREQALERENGLWGHL